MQSKKYCHQKEGFSFEFHNAKTKETNMDNQNEGEANKNSNSKQSNCLRNVQMRAAKSRWVLVSYLTVWEEGVKIEVNAKLIQLERWFNQTL